MKYKLIDKFLRDYGFNPSSEFVYERIIKIKMPDQIVIINGVQSIRPGKVGDLTMRFNIFEGYGEIKEDESIDEMPCVFCGVYFKDIEMLSSHFMMDEDSILNGINSFIRIFI